MTTANRYLEDRVAAIEHYLENDVATKEQLEGLRSEVNEHFNSMDSRLADMENSIQEILSYVKP